MEEGREGCTCTQERRHSSQDEEASAGIQFSPPLYLQRYMLAVEYLTKHSIKTVVDFGCAECGFFRLLSTVPCLQEISLVDIDRALLMTKTRVITPDLKDYVHRRLNPLDVFMYAGSAGEFDERMKNYEAVTLIEVIEHLHPDVLQSVTQNVFGTIHPQHVIVTTPNSEFNVLFGNQDVTTFRHWDHKFEWTRDEFRSWCGSICKIYGYCVEYTGVGFQASDLENSNLGPCSQAAFFLRKEEDLVTEWSCYVETLHGRHVNELIAKSEFPYDDSKMTVEEKLDMEITYTLHQIAQLRSKECGSNSEDRDGSICVKLCQIANRSTVKCLANIEQVREYLKQKSFCTLSEDGNTFTINAAELVDHESSCDDDDIDKKICIMCGCVFGDRIDDDNEYSSEIVCCSACNTNIDPDLLASVTCASRLSRCESDWDISDAGVK